MQKDHLVPDRQKGSSLLTLVMLSVWWCSRLSHSIMFTYWDGFCKPFTIATNLGLLHHHLHIVTLLVWFYVTSKQWLFQIQASFKFFQYISLKFLKSRCICNVLTDVEPVKIHSSRQKATSKYAGTGQVTPRKHLVLFTAACRFSPAFGLLIDLFSSILSIFSWEDFDQYYWITPYCQIQTQVEENRENH